MTDGCEYRFVIEAYSPDTLPMSRLAEYMAALAQLLGRTDRVHFVALERGSTVLVQRVEFEAVPEVRDRLDALMNREAPNDVTKAFEALDRHLAEDNAMGSLREADGTEVIHFLGRERPRPLTFGAFNQPGVLDGVLIRVGGRDDTVPVHLQDGDTIHLCNANRSMARRLGPYLYGPPLRVRGEGRWERDADGAWLMRRFNIADFYELDDAPLGEVVERLRGIEDSGWKEIEDPLTELRKFRGTDETL